MQAVIDGRRVAVIAAMVPELRPLVRRWRLARGPYPDTIVRRGSSGRYEIIAAVTCMGTAAARGVTERVLGTFAVDHVIVVGVAGAVSPDVSVGDLVVPEVVVDEGTGQVVHPVPLQVAAKGCLLTTDLLHNEPDELQGFIDNGVVAVDMETAAIGAVCEARQVPWSVFRAISDRAGDPAVDEAVVGLAKADGSADPAAIARFVITRPTSLPTLARLGRGLNRAVTVSTNAVLDALGEPASGGP
jgi:adenosylhomocysteine nucleosidase